MIEEKDKMPSDVITLERQFDVVIVQDEAGVFAGPVPELAGCHTQAGSLDELRKRMKNAVLLYLGCMEDRLKVWLEYKEDK